MKIKFFALALALELSTLVAPAFAQRSPMGGMGSPAPGADLAQFFGDYKAFSANAEVSTIMPSQGTPMTIPMKFALLGGKIRTEVDMAGMKGSQMTPARMTMMKQMGMDKIINIVQPEMNSMLMIYPSLKSYAVMTTPVARAADSANKAQVEKVALGKESIDGHDCEKNKVTYTDGKGQKHEALVWNASDLKGFPVQIQMTQSGVATTTKFSAISTDKPDAGLFEPPSDFTKYDSVQQLMQSAMMKNAGNFRPRQ